MQVIADGTEPNIALQITGNAEALSAGFSVELLEQRLTRVELAPAGEALPLEFRVRTLYNPEQREVNTFLPALMAIVLAFPALSTALSLVREREQGSLDGPGHVLRPRRTEVSVGRRSIHACRHSPAEEIELTEKENDNRSIEVRTRGSE